ncbi:MAG TPA: sulfotransferase [Actinomycetes bacterium]|nr:sulfotransferase [Actinomycetes bacterium]
MTSPGGSGPDDAVPERPIFILGCPRSGTTLLRVMLNAHPRIAIPPETRFLIPAYLRRRRFGSLRTPRQRERLARFVLDRPLSRFSRLQVSPDEVRARMDKAASLGAALAAPFAAYAERLGKARWGDKRPFYYSFVDELDRMYPDAQFVHVVRDGRACAASLKRPPFDYGSERAMVTWLNAVHSCRRAGERLGPERYHEVRYEDLVADPETSLRAMCAFLGEDFDPAMLAPEEVVDLVVPAGFEQHGQIKAGVNATSVAKWRQELSAGEIATMAAVAGGWLRTFGYEVDGGRAPLVTAARVRFGHWRYVRNLSRWRALDARQCAEEPPVAATVDASTWRRPPAPAGRGGRRLRRLTHPVRRRTELVQARLQRRRRDSLM